MIEEAKRLLSEMREQHDYCEGYVFALDLALWLMKREQFLQAALAEKHPGMAADNLAIWLRDNPQP